ncbi:MAG: hypothetical protein M1828_006316 [Chrysothrix sp. TS-e1954]|nr:MAG: hypothetical protein M1828_006316 [Chrysothrix sp. TS-e1954]
MQFIKTFVVSALVAVASAQLKFTSFPPSTVQAGSGSYSVNYMTAEGMVNTPVTIELRKGKSGNLGTISTTTAVGGVYVFKPSSSLADGSDYALSITQGSTTNYTPQFAVAGGSASSSSSSSASTAMMSSSASASMMSYSSSASTASMMSTTAAPYPAAAGNSTMGVGGASATGSGAMTPVQTIGTVGTVGTGSPTIARNTTFSSATLAPSTTMLGGGGSGGSGATATAQQSTVATGAAVRMDSSVALVFGILGAFAYLN